MIRFVRGTRILRVIHGRDARATSSNTNSAKYHRTGGALAEWCDLVRDIKIDRIAESS
jgi:hypothetical protein